MLLILISVRLIKCRDRNQMTTKKICEITKEAFEIKYRNYWKIIKLKWTNISFSDPFFGSNFESVQNPFNQSKYGRDHKIKHFACERDLFVREIPRIKHFSSHSVSKNFEYSRIKHFSSHQIPRKIFYTLVFELFRD